MTRASLRGWWRCCQDGREVNPAVWGHTCPDCSHEICISCEDFNGDSGYGRVVGRGRDPSDGYGGIGNTRHINVGTRIAGASVYIADSINSAAISNRLGTGSGAKSSSVVDAPKPNDAAQSLSTSFRPSTSSDAKTAVEAAVQSRCSSPNSDLELGSRPTSSTTMDVVITALGGLDVSSHVRERSVADSEESEEAESWSLVEELDSECPSLDRHAREQAELTLITFWDVFNRRREEFYQQRPALDQQGSTAHPPADVSENTTSASSTSAFRLLKRRHSRLGNDDEDDGQPPKRGKNELPKPWDTREKPRYSCPYRKHSRQRYNIHTHRTCALTGFMTIARVKEHLYRTHRASIQCPRCSLQFRDQQALKTHLISKVVCNYIAGQPVEGFELDVEEKLKSRRKTSADQTDAGRWQEIYRLLFPGESVPSPYFELPQDEPPPPNMPIEEFILNEVPKLVRSRVEEYFSSADNLALARETLVESMTSLVKQAIDATVVKFRTDKTEQGRSQDEIRSAILQKAPAQATSSSRGPRREDQLDRMQESLHSTSPPSLQSAHRSRDSSTSRIELSRRVSLTSTTGSHSLLQQVNQSDISEYVVLDVTQTGVDRTTEDNPGVGINSLITSHKGKEKATSPLNEGNDNHDFLADIDVHSEPLSYLDGHFSNSEVFDAALFEEEMERTFEEFFHDLDLAQSRTD